MSYNSEISPQVSIVNASAGSGKTYALAKQYIHLLLNPRDPQANPLREILAITFTNKATLQMKERILESLKKIALGNKKALVLMDAIMRDYHFFQVQTIDSFIKSILSGCTFKTEFSSSFRIKQDYSEDLAYSLDKLIEKTGQDKKVLNAFVKFLQQYLYVENRAGKASWFVKKDILSLMGTMFGLTNVYGDRFKKPDVKEGTLIIKKKHVLSSIKKLKDIAPEGTNQRFFKSLTSFLNKTQYTFDIDSIPASFARPEFPLNKGYPLPKETEKLWRTIRRGLKEVCEVESLSLLSPYIDIFDMVLDVFKNLAIRDDIIFLGELNRHARSLFDNSSITIGELYYRIATRLRHYLIDEFQDTSRLQWRNLVPMVEEALSTGGSLFCVSDRKQAIYRFRGGDAGLLDYVEDGFKKFNVEHKSLNMNYRSQKEIVLFNNEVFSEKNLKDFFDVLHRKGGGLNNREAEESLRNFQGSKQTYKKENTCGYVKVECVEALDKEDREELIKEKTVTLIKNLCKRFSYEDIAVLTRDNDEVELVTAWLLEKGIPVESDKTLNIKRHPYIKEIISFLKFLNSPTDNLSFASFILGDIFTRASGLSREQMRDFIFEKNRDSQKIEFFVEFKERYRNVWDNFIDSFFKSAGFVPLYEFTIGIFSRFNVIERFSEYQGFFMRFLELVKEQEEVNASIPLFLDFFDKAEGNELYVDIVDSKYVKVLTIHKSKGLEFPIVIIPFLGMDIRISPFTVYPEDKGLELRRLKKKYGSFSERLDALYREEYKKSFIDELNNIYVAFTRPKNELYVFIPEKSAGKNWVSLLIPMQEGKAEFGRQVETTVPPTQWNFEGVKIPPSRYKDWIPLLLDEFIDASKIRQRHRLLKGEVLHYILSCVGNLSDSNTKEIIKHAMKAVSLKFSFKSLAPFKSIIKKLLENKKMKRFFFLKDGVVYQEKEVVNRFGDTYRIDRLIVRKDAVEIVDYKSSRDDMESFRKQIRRYISAVKDLYPGKDVRGYLIFLDNFSVEEV